MADDSTIDDAFVAFVKRVEGGEQHRNADGRWYPYNTDGAGKWTIGRGHLINGGASPDGFAQGLTDDQVENLFRKDLEEAEAAARKVIGASFDTLPRKSRQLLTDFSFNLGPGFADEFPNMTRAVLRGDKATARAESKRFRTAPDGSKHPLKDRNAQTQRFFFGEEIPDATP